MLPSQAFHRPERASTGAVCPARPPACGAARGGERGAVIVHVAVAMMGLLAFAALSIDLGTLWVVRAQVQNAADAAALAGVVSLAYASPDPSAAQASALAIAQQNQVWGQSVTAAAVTSTVGTCPTGSPAIAGECINVTVSQGGSSGTPLPVFFSRLLTSMTPEVHASASGKVMLGNSSPCVAPIAIPDRWTEAGGTWSYASRFDRYVPGSPGVLVANPDSYVAPGPSSPGSGHLVSEMLGQEIVVVRGHIDAPEILGDNYYSLDLPRTGGEGLSLDDRYIENMTSCSGQTISFGDTVYTMGAHQTQTQLAVNQRYALDPGASWDGSKVIGSAYAVSPRIIQMVLYDPDQFAQVPTPVPEEYRAAMVVRNVVGFFITEPMDGHTISGVVVPVPGNFNQSAPAMTQDAAFMRAVALVR